MEYLIIIVGAGIIGGLIAYRVKHPHVDENRKCLVCGYSGPMKTWMGNYGLPQFTALFLLICFIIPGLLFIGWAWGKHMCPRCNALAKNIPAVEGFEVGRR